MMRYISTIALAVVIGGLWVAGIIGFASASATTKHYRSDGSWGNVGTFYDVEHSVFCASRVNAVSCVYVPRDTVHN